MSFRKKRAKDTKLCKVCLTTLAPTNMKNCHVKCKSKSVLVAYPGVIGLKKFTQDKDNKFVCEFCKASFVKHSEIQVSV